MHVCSKSWRFGCLVKAPERSSRVFRLSAVEHREEGSRIRRPSRDKSPKNAVFQYHLGLAYAKSGNTEEARKALEQALVLDPKFDGSADAQRVLAGLKG